MIGNRRNHPFSEQHALVIIDAERLFSTHPGKPENDNCECFLRNAGGQEIMTPFIGNAVNISFPEILFLYCFQIKSFYTKVYNKT